MRWVLYMADGKNRELILEIARRAAAYTPQWRFDPENPDAGTAIAMIWADMFAGTTARFGRLHENFRFALLDAIDSKAHPAVAAQGYLAFSVREDTDDFVIPAGTAVTAPALPDAALLSCHDLIANSAAVSDIYCVVPQADSVWRLDSLKNTALVSAVHSAPHIWTFTHGYALDVSRGANLRIIPEFTGGDGDSLAEALWEYCDGGVWRGLSVIRDGAALLCVFPEDKFRCDAVRAYVTHDAVLSGITAKPTGRNLFPDALYADYTQEQGEFYPFGQRYLPGACAYFACGDAFRKPGAQIELSFTLDYEHFEIEGYPEAQIYMKNIMRTSDFEPPKEYTITAARTIWEYYNGVGWAVLDCQVDAGLFGGASAGRIRIEFTCPSDLCCAVVGAHDLPFIRVRLVDADNLFRQRGRYITPRISDVRFAYEYGSGVPITDITAARHLDESAKCLPARLAAPPDGPAAVYFAFDNAFRDGTILFHVKPGGRSAGAKWEYFSQSGWQPLDVRDDTFGLCKTGLLSYQTRHCAENARLWGREAYWIRFVLDNHPQNGNGPYLYGLWENAVRAAARTPGTASILPAGMFSAITAPPAGVLSAVNPISSYGGTGTEDEARAIMRLSAAFSNSGRAVSAADCEELAMAASLRVRRVRFYPHTDRHGSFAYGRSCLVILAGDMEEYGFSELCDEVMAYITPRCALGAEEFSIIPPRYIAVNTTASIIIENHAQALSVKNAIEETLNKLLSPLNWEIGRLPAPSQINAAVRAASGVTRLIKSEVSYSLPSGLNAGYEKAAREPFILPVRGELIISTRSLNDAAPL